MSGKPPSPPGITSRKFWEETDRANEFLDEIPKSKLPKPAIPTPPSLEELDRRLGWAEHKVHEAEIGLEFAKTPEDKKDAEVELNKAQDRLDEINTQYEKAVRGRAAGLEETKPLTSATLGKKSMGKGRKKKRATRKRRSQKKWTSSATRRRN